MIVHGLFRFNAFVLIILFRVILSRIKVCYHIHTDILFEFETAGISAIFRLDQQRVAAFQHIGNHPLGADRLGHVILIEFDLDIAAGHIQTSHASHSFYLKKCCWRRASFWRR